jgi:hypothetical protein
MKKRIVRALGVIACLFTLVLASCKMSRANVYNYWKNDGTEILPKDHVVEEISISKLNKMVNKQSADSSDIFYVFYGNKSESNAQTAIKIFNEQAVQFEISTLYWLSSDLSDSKKSEVSEKFGVAKTSVSPAIYAFKGGKLVFDSSRPYYSNDSSTYTYVRLAQIAYRQLFDDNGDYSYKD